MLRSIGLYVFASLFFLAGVGHFVIDSFFIDAMPGWVPFRAAIVYLSGVVEMLLAVLLVYNRQGQKQAFGQPYFSYWFFLLIFIWHLHRVNMIFQLLRSG